MVKIDDIESIIIQQDNNTYKLIKRENDWAFVNLKNMFENGGYTKQSAYRMVNNNASKIISVPNKSKIYELWI